MTGPAIPGPHGPDPLLLLSLVLCTRNRAPFLEKALGSVSRLASKRPWGLVLVDNGSSDGTQEVLRRFVRETSTPTRLVHEPSPGHARARNAGWRAATGKIVAFTDDDCYPREDFVDAILTAFDGDARLGFVGGRVLLYDPNDLPLTIRTRSEPIHIPAHSFVPPGWIHGANFAFRRDVLSAIGGFDDRLGAGSPLLSGEDSDALSRASMEGFDGRYEPSIVVYHHHRRQKEEDRLALERAYSIGRGAYFAKSLLDRRARFKCLGHWGRTLRRYLRRRTLRRPAYEVVGAARFLLAAARRGRHVG